VIWGPAGAAGPTWYCDTALVNEHSPRYFEDYAVGTTYDCGSVTVDEASIIAFASRFDPQPFHVDPVAAAEGPFGGLVASGWHTVALVTRQLVDNYLSPASSLGGIGADEIRFPAPVRPGDTLRVRATALEARRSVSKPDRGIVKTLAEAANQEGNPAFRATYINFIRVRSLRSQRRGRLVRVNRRLMLLRHAKSDWPDGVPDQDRPLAKRGRRDAPVIGRWLRDRGWMPDAVVCSTALRAVQTWELVAPELGADARPPVTFQPLAYAASAVGLLELVRELPGRYRAALLIGHNPGLEELATGLAGQLPDGRLPTAAVAVLEFAGDWQALQPGQARLADFVIPADLSKKIIRPVNP
jgi:phosphohistidine phosphatase SixA/acyl dehydratase